MRTRKYFFFFGKPNRRGVCQGIERDIADVVFLIIAVESESGFGG